MQKQRGRPKGHKLSQETKDQIAESKTGYNHEEKTKDKIAGSVVKHYKTFQGLIQKCGYQNHGSHFYRDGSTKEYREFHNQIVNRKEHILWRFQVLFRDNFICQICRGPGNCTHHLVDLLKLKNYPELLYCTDIGLTLCPKCHGRLHWIIKNKQRLI